MTPFSLVIFAAYGIGKLITKFAVLPCEAFSLAARRMDYVNHATCLQDLRVPPSNRLEALKGNRKGQYSIRVNDQWRICFRFQGGDAYDVEFADYH